MAKRKNNKAKNQQTNDKDTESVKSATSDEQNDSIENIDINDVEETTSEVKDEEQGKKKSEEEDDSMKVLAPEPVSLADIEDETPVVEETKEEKPETEGKSANSEDESDRPPLPTRKKTEELPIKKENPILTQLKEAFPSIEEKYVKAVIIASKGSLDPAFNALLYLSDPKSGEEIELPSKPPSPQPQLLSRKQLTQLEQDEILARQLNDRFNKSQQRQHQRPQGHTDSRRGTGLGGDQEPIPFGSIDVNARRNHEQRVNDRRRRQAAGEFDPDTYQDDDSWAQFVDKDLPDITARANKSLQETASKVSNWFSGVTKNFAAPDENNNNSQIRQQEDELRYYENQRKQTQPERRRFNSFGARVGEESLESHGISLKNDEFSDDEDVPPQLPNREKNKESKPTSTTDEYDEANTSVVTNEGNRIISQTTYIDTPDSLNKRKWQPVPPEPLNATPTKINATTEGKKENKIEDEDDFLINSDDEL